MGIVLGTKRAISTVLSFAVLSTSLLFFPATSASAETSEDIVDKGSNKPIFEKQLSEIKLSKEGSQIRIATNIDALPYDEPLSLFDVNTKKILVTCTTVSDCEIKIPSEVREIYAQSGNIISKTLIVNSSTSSIRARNFSVTANQPGWSLNLSSDKSSFKVGEPVVLTATSASDANISNSGSGIYVFDTTNNKLVRSYANGNSVGTNVAWTASDKSRTFKAYIASWSNNTSVKTPYDLTDIKAESLSTTISRANWTLSLTNCDCYSGAFKYDAETNQDLTLSGYDTVLHDETYDVWTYDNESGYSIFEEHPRVIAGYIGIPILNSSGKVIGVKDVQASSNIIFNAPPQKSLTRSEPADLSDTYGGSNPSQDCYQTCEADPVNTFNGEYWETIEDIQPTTGYQPPLNYIRAYSANRSNEDSGMGYGWMNNYSMHLSIKDIDGVQNSNVLTESKSIDVYQENGATVSFYRNSIDSSYLTLASTEATLKYDSSTEKFYFNRFNGQKFEFDKSGKLTSIKDINGNSLSLTYQNGKLMSIQDINTGKSVSLAWTDDHITKASSSTGLAVYYEYANGYLEKVTDVGGKQWTYTYNGDGKIETKTNPLLDTVTNTYNAEGRVDTQTDELGRVTSFYYSGYSDITEITHPDNTVTTYEYENGQLSRRIDNDYTDNSRTTLYSYDSSNGRLITRTNPDNSEVKYTYDNRGNILSSTNALGQTSTTTYDNYNNPLVVTDPSGKTNKYTYDLLGRVASSTDGENNVATTEWTTKGLLSSITDSKNNKTLYTYDSSGFLNISVDANGNSTTYSNDSNGNLLEEKDALNNITKYSYDAYGNRIKTIDPAGFITSYEYDALNNNISTSYPDGSKVSVKYNAFGLPIEKADALGNISKIEYDSMSRPVQSTSPKGYINKVEYNSFGEVIATTNPANKKTSFEYNSMGLNTKTTLPSGKQIKSNYDLVGNKIKIINPDATFISYKYDASGNVKQVIDEEGRSTSYAYNKNNNLLQETRGDGKSSSYEYDSNGNTISYIDESARKATYAFSKTNQVINSNESGITKNYEYDKVDNLVKESNSDSSFISYAYDNRNLLKQKSYSDNTPIESITYDSMGRQKIVTDQSGTSEYNYDLDSKILSVNNSITGKVSYGYDKNSNPSSITYPSGTKVTYSYDSSDRLTAISNTNTGNFIYAYNNDSLNSTINFPNGLITQNTYDANNQIKTIETKKGTSSLFKFDYSYDKSGLQTTQSTTSSSVNTSKNYAYDLAKRMSSSTSGSITNTISYSDNNSIVKQSDGSTLEYNDKNRLTKKNEASNIFEYGYDARGNRILTKNITAGSSNSYTYNISNRLTQANLSANPPNTNSISQVAFKYNVSGLRIQKETIKNNQTTQQKYVWDSNGEVPVLLDDNEYEYIYGDSSSPIAQINKTTKKVQYLHKDSLNSIRGVTDSTGIISANYLYDEYGKTTQGEMSHATTSFGFAGEYLDKDLGFYYLRNRWMDPNTSQFISVDPILNQTHLAYGYTAGNPLQYVDPLGLVFWKDPGFWSNASTFLYGATDYLTSPGGVVPWVMEGGFNADHDLQWYMDNYSVTEQVRMLNGEEELADKCSGYYTGGKWTGIAISYFVATKGVGKSGPQIEYRNYNSVSLKKFPKQVKGSSKPATSGKAFTPKGKEDAYKKNPEKICVFCRLSPKQTHNGKTQVDHAVAKSKGGDNTPENAQIACQRCNASKGNGAYPKTPPPNFEKFFPNETWPPSWAI